MGLFDRLTKEGRAKSALEGAAKKVLNKHAQSPDRFAAMEKLRDIGSDEALYALARRFSFVYDKGIEDEQEKEWVADVLTDKGETAIPAVARYLKSAESLSWPLRVLERIGKPDQILAAIDDLLTRDEPGYTRDPTKKLQILTFLSEWKGASSAEISRRVVPYLADFDEGVRFAAVDAIAIHKDEETSRAPLLDALARPEEESRRIKVRCAEVLVDAGWQVTSHKERVTELLADTLPEFGMQQDRLTKKKGNK
jgi:hypothetical protein